MRIIAFIASRSWKAFKVLATIVAIVTFCSTQMPAAVAGREASNLDAKLSFINMMANRIFWSMWAGLPYCGGVTEPTCWDSKKFRSNIEQDSEGRYRLSRRVFVDAGFDSTTNRSGPKAVWVAACRPVSFAPTIYDDIQKGYLLIRWPNLVDGHAFIRRLLDMLTDAASDIHPYRIDKNRAKEIYASRAKDSSAVAGGTDVKYWTSTYPDLEIYFDRKISTILKVKEWLSPIAGTLEIPEPGWNQVRIQVRP